MREGLQFIDALCAHRAHACILERRTSASSQPRDTMSVRGRHDISALCSSNLHAYGCIRYSAVLSGTVSRQQAFSRGERGARTMQ